MPAGRQRSMAPAVGDRHIALDVVAGVIRNAFADRCDSPAILLRQLLIDLNRAIGQWRA